MGGDGETQVVLELQTRVSLRQAGIGLGIGFVTEGELRIKSLGVCFEQLGGYWDRNYLKGKIHLIFTVT